MTVRGCADARRAGAPAMRPLSTRIKPLDGNFVPPRGEKEDLS